MDVDDPDDGIGVLPTSVDGTTDLQRQFLFSPPHAIHDVDGRFAVPAMPAVVDLIVSGPGFARTIVRGVDARHGIGRRGLEIAVERGQRITGVVRDATGRPVRGTEIALEQTGALTHDELFDLANGNYRLATRADGSFAIDGVVRTSLIEDHVQAVVRDPMDRSIVLASHPIDLSANDSQIDIALFPVGALSGKLGFETGPRRIVTVWASPTTAPSARSQYAMTDDRGAFRFATLPAGEYVVGFWRLPVTGPLRERFTRKISGGFTVRAGVETVVTIR